MARPTKFDPKIASLVLAHVEAGATRGKAAKLAGISLRAVQYWLARGRMGVAPFDAFAKHLDHAADRVRRDKVRARYEREAEASKARWQVFRAARERWWLDRLGPTAFWVRRYEWSHARGKDQAKARAMNELVSLASAKGGDRSPRP